MIDLGISKMALIGAVALIVIGPEKLPRVARTVGTLLGKAQRYVADVKAEVNRSMELDELRKMRDTVQQAASNVEQAVQTYASDFEQQIQGPESSVESDPVYPSYRHPQKNWRLKRGATPRWYKVRHGTRTHVQSGSARVARFRPKKPQV
ncbi:Sec-independent protein translocase protein TatB [Curvibacter sp. CHRR-16]|uniref:Sec-independent protein translocase protein TatB n=1 Tax=Curvibacter sp. CHRR-16 TaxID=2835872 RepID=UPI001BD961D9|nr:Sec-independent protein translocase protein TatB [Curvibacter sp. CHRR-16]